MTDHATSDRAHTKALGWDLVVLNGNRRRLTNCTGAVARDVKVSATETQVVLASSDFLYHGAAILFRAPLGEPLAVSWVDSTSGMELVRHF